MTHDPVTYDPLWYTFNRDIGTFSKSKRTYKSNGGKRSNKVLVDTYNNTLSHIANYSKRKEKNPHKTQLKI